MTNVFMNQLLFSIKTQFMEITTQLICIPPAASRRCAALRRSPRPAQASAPRTGEQATVPANSAQQTVSHQPIPPSSYGPCPWNRRRATGRRPAL